MKSHLKRALAHVYWIGGSPCSGKSSIVEWLAAQHGLQTYRCDEAFWRHSQIVTPDKQPAFYRLTQLTWDEIWMRPVDVQLRDEIAVYREEFDLIIRDLSDMPHDRPIVAEGAALMPEWARPLLSRPIQAVWMIPTETFQRRFYPQRGAWVQDILKQCRHPQQAFQNWMDRDAAFARQVRADAELHGLRVLIVDGTRSVAENAQAVETWFFGGPIG